MSLEEVDRNAIPVTTFVMPNIFHHYLISNKAR